MNCKAFYLVLILTLLANFISTGCSTPDPPSARALTIGAGQTLLSEGASGKNPTIMAHTLAGFEKCTSCHYLGTTGAIHLVNDAHVCDECHVMLAMPGWSHGLEDNFACVICHEEPGF